MVSHDLENNILNDFLDHNIFLYGDKPPKNLDLIEIATYLKELGFHVSIRGDFMKHFRLENEEHGSRLAQIRIKNVNKRGFLNEFPSKNEVYEELEMMIGIKPLNIMMPYEGYSFSNILKKYVDHGLHIVFTSRTLLIWSDRYHGKTIVMDPPLTVVSTTGIVEAPAKPRRYYSQLMNYHRMSQLDLPMPYPSEEKYIKDLKRQLKGTFIDYDDERLSEVSKGFTLQGIIYSIFGDAFCDRINCRLYNAHTQKDLLISQLGDDEFCFKHRKLIEYIKARAKKREI